MVPRLTSSVHDVAATGLSAEKIVQVPQNANAALTDRTTEEQPSAPAYSKHDSPTRSYHSISDTRDVSTSTSNVGSTDSLSPQSASSSHAVRGSPPRSPTFFQAPSEIPEYTWGSYEDRSNDGSEKKSVSTGHRGPASPPPAHGLPAEPHLTNGSEVDRFQDIAHYPNVQPPQPLPITAKSTTKGTGAKDLATLLSEEQLRKRSTLSPTRRWITKASAVVVIAIIILLSLTESKKMAQASFMGGIVLLEVVVAVGMWAADSTKVETLIAMNIVFVAGIFLNSEIMGLLS